jgi:hypothetical protein
VCKTRSPTKRINGILLISFVEIVMDIQTCLTRLPTRSMGVGIVVFVVSSSCLLQASTFGDFLIHTSSLRSKPQSVILFINLNM